MCAQNASGNTALHICALYNQVRASALSLTHAGPLQRQKCPQQELGAHRIMGWLGRELEDYPVPIPFHYTLLRQSLSNLALNILGMGLSQLPQGLTTLSGRNFFLLLHLSMLSRSGKSGKPFPLVFSLQALAPSPSPALLSPFRHWKSLQGLPSTRPGLSKPCPTCP